MKNSLIILYACIICTFSAVAQEQKTVDLLFDETLIELGEIKRGDVRKTAFTFTNTGTEALQIDLVSGCECTTLDWPRLPIQSGEKATIDVIFDSTEKEESGEVEIDIIFKNQDPDHDRPLFKIVSYTFELIP